jgi:hypothetical protein
MSPPRSRTRNWATVLGSDSLGRTPSPLTTVGSSSQEYIWASDGVMARSPSRAEALPYWSTPSQALPPPSAPVRTTPDGSFQLTIAATGRYLATATKPDVGAALQGPSPCRAGGGCAVSCSPWPARGRGSPAGSSTREAAGFRGRACSGRWRRAAAPRSVRVRNGCRRICAGHRLSRPTTRGRWRISERGRGPGAGVGTRYVLGREQPK